MRRDSLRDAGRTLDGQPMQITLDAESNVRQGLFGTALRDDKDVKFKVSFGYVAHGEPARGGVAVAVADPCVYCDPSAATARSPRARAATAAVAAIPVVLPAVAGKAIESRSGVRVLVLTLSGTLSFVLREQRWPSGPRRGQAGVGGGPGQRDGHVHEGLVSRYADRGRRREARLGSRRSALRSHASY